MTVSVIVLNFNGMTRDYLRACLESLRRQSYPHIQILVVDNASRDDSAAYVSQAHPEALLVETGSPVGFGAANNLGLARAVGDYVLFANNDVTFHPDCIERLVSAVTLAEDIGMAAPKLLRPSQAPGSPRLIDSAGTLLRRELTMYDRGWETPDRGQFDTPAFIFGSTGAAAFFRRRTLESIRYEDGTVWDEDFHYYYEDGDLAWRARNAGWRCIYFPAAVAEHHRGASMPPKFFDKTRPFKVDTIKNRYLMIVKNVSGSTFIWNLPFFLAREILIWGYLLFQPGLMFDTCRALWSSMGRAFEKRRRTRRSGNEVGLFAAVPCEALAATFKTAARPSE